MLTINDIMNISFRKSRGAGYKTDDVDNFIDQVVESYDLLIKKGVEQKDQLEALTAENQRLEKEMAKLKEENKQLAARPAPAPAPAKPQTVKPEDIQLSEECEYTQEEIKNALLSAQKLANATIREARQKAEVLLTEANAKAERIVTVAQGEVNGQKEELERLRKLVSDFRASLLDKYKEHLQLVNALPTQAKPVAKATASAKPATPAKQAKPAAKPASSAKPAEPAPAPAPKPTGLENKETMSQTQSFHLGKQLDETGEFSELKFGADYDITKE